MKPGNGRSEGLGRKARRRGDTQHTAHEAPLEMPDRSRAEITPAFCRTGTACVPVNNMNIVRAFVEGLSWCQCYLLSALQLHHNGALKYVNKCMCIVSVDSARPAWRMLYCDHQNFPAGILRKVFRHERRDLRLLSHRRAGHEA